MGDSWEPSTGLLGSKNEIQAVTIKSATFLDYSSSMHNALLSVGLICSCILKSISTIGHFDKYPKGHPIERTVIQIEDVHVNAQPSFI